MSNRVLFSGLISDQYREATVVSDNPSTYLRYNSVRVFSTTFNQSDSAHNDGYTQVYRSFLLRRVSVKGFFDFYSRQAHGLTFYVDICGLVSLNRLAVPTLGNNITKKDIFIYSRPNDILFRGRYKGKRKYLGTSGNFPGINDVVVDHVEFEFTTTKDFVLFPDSAVFVVIMVHTNKSASVSHARFNGNVVSDIRYDVN